MRAIEYYNNLYDIHVQSFMSAKHGIKLATMYIYDETEISMIKQM